MIFQNKHRKSGNSNAREIHRSAAPDNVHEDQFNAAREALKQILSFDERYLIKKLTIQILGIKSVWEKVDKKFINQWSNVMIHRPRNIYNFTVRYFNRTLAIDTNLIKLGYIKKLCLQVCDEQQNHGHLIGGCRTTFRFEVYKER